MKTIKNRAGFILLALTITFFSFDTPNGWFKAGSEPNSYDMGIDKGMGQDGKSAATIQSIRKRINGFGTLMQNCSPNKFLGKRIRMTAYLKTQDVKNWSGIWLRIDERGTNDPLGFDNMHDGKNNRSIKGTTDWTKYEIVLDVPLKAYKMVSATCIEDVTACFIPRQVFLDLLQSNAEINKQMFKALCHDMGLNNEKVQSLAQKSVRERVAETILYLHQTFAQKSVEEEPVIPISLPREDLANIVGTATETLIRLLSEFKTDKYIDFEGKRIKILNKEALERISHATV